MKKHKLFPRINDKIVQQIWTNTKLGHWGKYVDEKTVYKELRIPINQSLMDFNEDH